MVRLIHVDDLERGEAYSMLVDTDAPRYADLGMRQQTFARMLFYTLWDDGGGFPSYDAGLDYLRGYQFVCSEIRQLVGFGVAASKHAAKGIGPCCNLSRCCRTRPTDARRYWRFCIMRHWNPAETLDTVKVWLGAKRPPRISCLSL
jgi:hypothetical protein